MNNLDIERVIGLIAGVATIAFLAFLAVLVYNDLKK